LFPSEASFRLNEARDVGKVERKGYRKGRAKLFVKFQDAGFPESAGILNRTPYTSKELAASKGVLENSLKGEALRVFQAQFSTVNRKL